jgi:hypothetical protein
MSFKLHPRRTRNESGYVLLTLLLAMALMAIFAATLVSSISFDIKRDREEEMVHRGTQYSRAIRAYFKKFGRYPIKLEDLDNTQNIRFLRKHYKDPLNCKPTCQDFKLLHYGEVQMSMGGGIGGGTIPGASAIGGASGGLNSPGGFGQSSPYQPAPGFNGPTFGANANSSFGQNSQPTNNLGATDPSQAGAQGSSSQPGSQPGTPGDATNGDGASTGSSSSGFSGGNTPIVGVASTKKDTTIREYNKKKKYNEWYFIYDPSMDRGGLITTPYQPQTQTAFGQQGIQNQNGQIGSGINTITPSGPIPGMLNNPNTGMEPNSTGLSPAQPQPPPQQQ